MRNAATGTVPPRPTGAQTVKLSRSRKREGYLRPALICIEVHPNFFATRFDINRNWVDDDQISLDPASDSAAAIKRAVIAYLSRLIGQPATVSRRGTNAKRRKARRLYTIECRLEIIPGVWITRLDAPQCYEEEEAALDIIRTQISALAPLLTR